MGLIEEGTRQRLDAHPGQDMLGHWHNLDLPVGQVFGVLIVIAMVAIAVIGLSYPTR